MKRFGTVLPTRTSLRMEGRARAGLTILGGKWNGEVVAVDGSVGTVNVSSSFSSNSKAARHVYRARQLAVPHDHLV